MDKVANDLIFRRKNYIKNNMILDDIILDALEEERALSNEDVEDIQAERTNTRKISMLLRKLPRKGPNGFQAFLSAISIDYSFLAQELFEEYTYMVGYMNKESMMPEEVFSNEHTNNDDTELKTKSTPKESSYNNTELTLKDKDVLEKNFINNDETELKKHCTSNDETELKVKDVSEERYTNIDETELKKHCICNDEAEQKVKDVSEERCTNIDETELKKHCTCNDETELKVKDVSKERCTDNNETEPKVKDVSEERCTDNNETEPKVKDVSEERCNDNDETELKKHCTKNEETKVKARYDPDETNNNRVTPPNTINTTEQSMNAFLESPSPASMSNLSYDFATQSNLNIIFMKLNMYLYILNERENSYSSPVFATFDMIKQLLDQVTNLGIETYRLVRGANRVPFRRCIETMMSQHTNLQGRLLEREERIQKYANKIYLLETKIKDYEAQLRQKENNSNQKENELEEAKRVTNELKQKLEEVQIRCQALQDDRDATDKKLQEIREENKELKDQIAANQIKKEQLQNRKNGTIRQPIRRQPNDQTPNFGISGTQVKRRK